LTHPERASVVQVGDDRLQPGPGVDPALSGREAAADVALKLADARARSGG
jgi:hypothetical protein